jgi:tetratricopeptide (TPR) repeat protein
MTHRLIAVPLALLLGACAQPPSKPETPPPAAEAPKVVVQPRVVVAKPPPRQPVLPKVELTDQVMFKLMLAEVAMQRGQAHVAVPAYLELARETRDPRIAQRATETAWNARFISAALEAAGIWLQADPESVQARQVLAALLVNQSQLSDALPHLEKWLASDRSQVAQSFLQLSSLLGRNKDRQAVFDLMRALAKPYPQVPEARLAVAQAASNAGEPQIAIDEAKAALALKPDWELAALFTAQMLQRQSNAQAIAFLGGYVKAHPDAKDARLNYARLLVNEKRYPEARVEFEALSAAFPQNPDVMMAIALLAMQSNDFDVAERQLKRVLETDYPNPDQARLYLGQVSEERERYGDALKWYESVAPGEEYIGAQVRYANVLAKQGNLAAARKHLQQVAAPDTQQRVRLVQAEAQLLRDANLYRESFELLGKALEKMPNYPDLLYDYAMAAEKVQRFDLLEENLRKLIQIRPDHAHARNALGYTLADRNERLEEAHALIDAALKLSPDDPFIMDSMGWVLFRQGLQQQSLEFLQRAHILRPDADIAAHLGEVLWAMGNREQAQKIWSDALRETPRNELLQNTIKRFAPRILPAAR